MRLVVLHVLALDIESELGLLGPVRGIGLPDGAEGERGRAYHEGCNAQAIGPRHPPAHTQQGACLDSPNGNVLKGVQ